MVVLPALPLIETLRAGFLPATRLEETLLPGVILRAIVYSLSSEFAKAPQISAAACFPLLTHNRLTMEKQYWGRDDALQRCRAHRNRFIAACPLFRRIAGRARCTNAAMLLDFTGELI
ncbi:MAG: hypothetical protein R3D27_04370 [Hyphomicrobiaceae bacterium]